MRRLTSQKMTENRGLVAHPTPPVGVTIGGKARPVLSFAVAKINHELELPGDAGAGSMNPRPASTYRVSTYLELRLASAHFLRQSW